MNPIEKFLSRWGYIREEKAAMPSVYAGSGLDSLSIFRSSNKIDPGRAMDVYTGWVYASIRAIGMDVGSIEHRLFRTGGESDTEIFQNELLDILGAVNDYQTSFDLMYTIAAHLELTGNAYIFLDGVKSETDKPTALHIMNPARVKVGSNREEFPPRVLGYQYRLGTNVFNFQPYQVLHIKYPDPSNVLEGIGTVQTIAQWIDSDNDAMEFNRNFFKNGARVGAILSTDAAHTPDQLEYLKASFEAAFKGIKNAYKALALPKGVKYEESGKTQKDLDFANLMDMMRDRIIAGFKVPRTALGITDDVNRANAEATDYVFAARTIKPIMKIITTYLNEFLVPRYGDDLYLKFKDPVPEDRAVQIDEMNKSLGSQGATPTITINEAREKYFGLDPIDGGDELFISFNLQPISESSKDSGTGTPTGTPKSVKVEARRMAKTRFALNNDRRRSITKDLAKKTALDIAAIFTEANEMKEKAKKNITTLSDDEYEVLWKAFTVRVDPYEKKIEKALQDFNARTRKEVIGNLPQIVKAIDKNDLFDKDGLMKILVDLMKPIEYALAAKEGKEAAALLGFIDMDIMTPEVRKALDDAISLLSKSYNDTTRDLLKAKLEQGLQEGLSQDQLATTINDVFDYSDEVRATQVARTETFRVANYSTQEAWKQSGIVKSQRWYTASDERVCPWCGPQQGKVVSIDEDFFKKGETVTGSDGSTFDVDYSDVGAPPLHVNCRCYIRPEDINIS